MRKSARLPEADGHFFEMLVAHGMSFSVRRTDKTFQKSSRTNFSKI